MPHLPDVCDRLWHAYCCLPRDEHGELPSLSELERVHNLSRGTMSRAFTGQRTQHSRKTFHAMCAAVKAAEAWIEFGGTNAPTTTEVVPPRPGMKWRKHGELVGWLDAVEMAKRDPNRKIPDAAFDAGADLPVYRHPERITPELAAAVAAYAWETSTPAEQTVYSTRDAERASAGGYPSAKKLRASAVHRPAK